MSRNPAAEQSHIKNYDYRIQRSLQTLWSPVAKFAVASLILSVYIYYLYDYLFYVPHSYGRKADMMSVIHFFLGFVFAPYILSLSLGNGLEVIGVLRDIYYQIRYKNIARKYSSTIHYRVYNALSSVEPFLVNQKKAKRTPRRIRKIFRQYVEFERISTDELKRRLESAGVFDVGVQWYQRGKTIEDALMLAAYSSRLEAEEAKRQATEKSLEAVEAQRQTTPDIHSRKNQELAKEAIEKELEKYVGSRSQSEPEELKNLGGQYVIHSNNGEKAKIAFTLAAGEYIAELYDFREQRQESEGFRVEQDGGLYILKLNGRGFSDHTEITLIRKETGARDEIQLW